jgi:DNA-binding NarL/FixJ family response regulator
MTTIRAKENRIAGLARRRRAEKVIELARGGHTNTVIAKNLGVDPATVKRILAVYKAGGIPELHTRQTVERAEIRRLSAAGIGPGEIGRRLSLSQPAIRRALKADPKDDIAGQRRAEEKERLTRQVRELRAGGLTQMAIAARLGIGRRVVRGALLDRPVWQVPRKALPIDPNRTPRGRALAVLELVRQGIAWEQIAARLHVTFLTISRVIAVENAGGTATIQLRRSSRRQQDRQRLRALQAHALANAKRALRPREIARRLGVSVLTIRIDLARDFRSTGEIAAQRRAEQREQRAQQVRALRSHGLSQRAIARELGISHGTVGNDLSASPQCGALLRRGQRARDLYLKEIAVSDIAAELQVQPGRVRQYLGLTRYRVQWRYTGEVRRLARRGVTSKKIAQRLGLPIGVVQRVHNTGRVLLQDKFAAQVQALYAQGLSKHAIGHELNLSPGTINRALEKRVVRRARIRLHPDRRRALRVLTLVAAGISRLEIHRRLGISLHTICRVVRIAEAGRAVTIRPTSQPDAKRVRQLFKMGIAIDAIARRLRMSVNTIREILDLGKPIPPDVAARIRELHAAGVSKDQIAKELKINSRDVYRILPPGHELTRTTPTPASTPRGRSMPRRRRRALTVKAFADQHRLDIQDVRAAIRDGSINTLVIGKTVLIPNTESARLLRKAYAELSIMAAGSPGAVPTSPIASRPAALKSDPPSNS